MNMRHFSVGFAALLWLAAGMGPVVAGDFNAQRAKIVTAEEEARWLEKLPQFSRPAEISAPAISGRHELGRTWYDYAFNNVMGRTVAHAYTVGNDGIHFVFMKILPQGSTRCVAYDYWDENLQSFWGNMCITENYPTGWGRVVNGKNDEALISFHGGGAHLWNDAGEANYFFTPLLDLNPGVFAGFARSGDTLVFVSQQENVNWAGGDWFKYSTDYGATWLDGANISLPGVTDYGNAERWPEFNPANPPESGYLIAPASIGSLHPNGSVYLCATADWGANWQTTLVWDDDSVVTTQFGSTRYIIENYAQMNGFYSADGAYHAVFGAVQGVRDINTATMIDLWPILYWNSAASSFTWLTSLEYSAPDDPITRDALQNKSPNSPGNSCPQVARGPHPGELVCTWQQWEKNPVTGSIVLLNAAAGGGTTTAQIFATDIWGAYSNDNGLTWSEPVYLAGQPSQSEVFPNIPEDFIWNATGDSIYLDILYLHDTNPGISIYVTPLSDPSECIWYYQRAAMAAQPAIVGVGGNPPVSAEQFYLHQNYPNPFNPVTTIRYRVARAANVTLKIYDLTGREVAVPVNGPRRAGEHEVLFDAGKLASGVYFYRLSAEGFSQVRKMLLLR